MNRTVSIAIGSMFLALGSTQALADTFVDQPAKKHSNITCNKTPAPKDAESLSDANFATALHNALGDNGFHSMVITFAQCFGGGMIDDVADQFQNSTKPISMTSGSRHDERSRSGPHGPTNKDTGFNYWSESYKNVHRGKSGGTNNNPTEADAFNNAQNDPAWTSQPGTKKIVQHKTLNNGGNIKLGDGTGGSGATSFHAIIFTGKTAGKTGQRSDYWNDAARQHKMLTDSGYPASNIKVLHGSGAAPNDAAEPQGDVDAEATRANLLAQISALSSVMDSNEQLYIYIGDHGSKDQGGDTKQIPPKATRDNTNTFNFDPLDSAEISALDSSDNTSGPYVEMNITGVTGVITSNWEVLFNDVAINFGDNLLPGGVMEANVRFLVDPDDVDLSAAGNFVWLRNATATDSDIEVEACFAMGDLETVRDSEATVPILSPWAVVAMTVLLMTAGITFVCRRWT